MENKEQVITDLESYMKLKQEAHNNQLSTTLLKIICFNLTEKVKEALSNEGIEIKINKGESFETTDMEFNFELFQKVQEIKQKAKNFTPPTDGLQQTEHTNSKQPEQTLRNFTDEIREREKKDE